MMTGNLFEKICATAPNRDRTFIETHDGRVVSYGDLFDASGRYANALRTVGVEFGDRVAVQVDKSPECVLLYLACLRLGAVYLPLNQAYTLAELEYFIGDSEPRLVVCAPERAGEIGVLAERLGVGATLTLGIDGKIGSLIERARNQPADFARRHLHAGRPGGDPLHLRHHRPVEGRDADPSQPPVECRDLEGDLALHRR